MRHIRTPLFVAVTALLLVLPSVANAITDGAPDGSGHPNVGALIADVPGAGLQVLCSGTLISPDVFLTAGHCTAQLPDLGVDSVYVSLDATLDRTTRTLRPGRFVTDPSFDPGRKDPHDLGVVLLESPVEGVVPAQLPRSGELGSLALADVSFTNVGYGYYDLAGRGKPQLGFDGVRRVSTSTYAGLDASMLKLSQDPGARLRCRPRGRAGSAGAAS